MSNPNTSISHGMSLTETQVIRVVRLEIRDLERRMNDYAASIGAGPVRIYLSDDGDGLREPLPNAWADTLVAAMRFMGIKAEAASVADDCSASWVTFPYLAPFDPTCAARMRT
jgi:hypothetical protein